ncbi:MAG: serine hydrolase [Leptospiraceae bacterium]|nr:serine hydrolase [Leptospiraceae bacterium]
MVREAFLGTNLHSLLIEHHGRIVTEAYGSGADSPINERYGIGNPFAADVDFDAETLHDIRSISKSVVAFLYGVALEERLVPPIEALAIDSFPEIGAFAPGIDRIRIKDLLDMTVGLEWDEGGLPNDETSLFYKADQIGYFFDRGFAATPGTKFHYNSGATAMLATILVRGTGRSLSAYGKEKLFDPMEIRRWEWVRDYHDRELAFTGLRLLPRDMIKLGRLVQDNGRFKEKQIIPLQWMAMVKTPQISTGYSLASSNLTYGFQWWSGIQRRGGDGTFWLAGFGNGGQRIYIVPSLELIVVFTAGEYGDHDINEREQRIFESIVIAISE